MISFLLVETEEGGLLLELTLCQLFLGLLFPVLLGHLMLSVVGILAATRGNLLIISHLSINGYRGQKQ